MRNPEMTKIRDRKMVETFYLLYDKKRIRLEDVLLRMSHDLFFLDQNYIYKRIFYISENLSYYEQLKEGKITLPEIQRSIAGWLGYVKHADSYNLRKSMFNIEG